MDNVDQVADVPTMFVIYNKPSDYPEAFVVRCFVIMDGESKPTANMHTAPTLEAARALVPGGHHCVPRFPCDDPVIVETWI